MNRTNTNTTDSNADNNLMRNFLNFPFISGFMTTDNLPKSTFNRDFPSDDMTRQRGAMGVKPVSEIHELATHYLAWVEMPGVKLPDVNIKFRKNDLIITGIKRGFEAKEKNKNEIIKSTVQNQFKFIMNIGEPIEPSKIEASFEDGILKLAIPKKHPSEERVIAVKSGTGTEFRKLYEAEAILNERQMNEAGILS